jgi:hypothetical protein
MRDVPCHKSVSARFSNSVAIIPALMNLPMREAGAWRFVLWYDGYFFVGIDWPNCQTGIVHGPCSRRVVVPGFRPNLGCFLKRLQAIRPFSDQRQPNSFDSMKQICTNMAIYLMA